MEVQDTEIQDLLQEWLETSYWLLDSLNSVEQEKVKSLRQGTQQLLDKLLQSEPERVPLSSLKVHTDFWTMCDEIKEYTRSHGGKIIPCDIPEKLMMGFVHENGTHWAIKLWDVKKTSSTDSNRDRVLGNIIHNDSGTGAALKMKLCEAMSGTTDFTTEHEGKM